MRRTRIVTAFIRDGDRFLILRRSSRVKTMKGMWAAVSGIIEGDEEPLHRAKTEIREELGIAADRIALVRAARRMAVTSPQYSNHEWVIFPFLFSADSPRIRLNWENSEYRWVSADQIAGYRTVPNLERVLRSLL